jgi:hypothetical protein
VSVLLPPIDPNERFRERRATSRRRKRLRRSILVGTLLVGVALLGVGARFVGGAATTPAPTSELATLATVDAAGPRPLPVEIRGVHVTLGLASLPGKLQEYVDLQRDGLTAIELELKDENGRSASLRVPSAGREGGSRA